nr:unnamed protein product [Callosobruchus analis]
MLDSPQLESFIKHLGGSVVDSVDDCSVLVTESVKRSMKLLAAVGLAKPICSPAWIRASKSAREFLDPWDYILVDEAAESKWDFSLKESLERASRKKLFENYVFQMMATNAVDVLKVAIQACGGKCLAKVPREVHPARISSWSQRQSRRANFGGFKGKSRTYSSSNRRPYLMAF